MTAAGSLSSQIATRLEAEILSGQRGLGDRLDERELAEHFNASRTPVREALQRLAATGLVQVNGRHGTNVARLTLTQLLDAFRVVSELEAMAAEQTVGRITAEQIADLWVHQRGCEEAFAADDVDAFCIANDHLHSGILAASGNWMLQEQMRTARVLSPYRRHITYQPGRMARSLDEHRAFIAAIEAGDGAGAASHMRSHVNALATGLSDFLYFLRRTGNDEIIASGQ
ncbi:MAG: GntR family transcriptional regulator [Hyphomicrobiales bacterium]|nr:GntR family transcriptional regulator [Hyphomicrobiales bacterium]